MKHILKNRSSKGYHRLTALKRKNGTYEDVKNDKSKNDYIRDKIINSLLEEQDFQCAYCMKSINLENTFIEHIIGQKYIKNRIEIGKQNEINYDNFLAVCDGKSCKDELHCDKSRANYQKERPLFSNPLQKRIMENIKFTNKGLVYYKNFVEISEFKDLKEHTKLDEDSNIKYDIQVVLNLNCINLKEKREIVIKALKRITNNWEKEKVRKQYNKYLSNPSKEFSQVVIYHLSKRL